MPIRAAEAQTLEIAYVDSWEVLNSYPEAVAAQERFDNAIAPHEMAVMVQRDVVASFRSQLKKERSPGERAKLERFVQVAELAYQRRTTDFERIGDQLRAELVQPFMDRITEVIETMREERQYALIIDVGADSIISADPTLDLTQEVLRRLGRPRGRPFVITGARPLR